MRVDYVLKSGERGVWDYDVPDDTDVNICYGRDLEWINGKLGGKLDRLVFVSETETDTGELKST